MFKKVVLVGFLLSACGGGDFTSAVASGAAGSPGDEVDSGVGGSPDPDAGPGGEPVAGDAAVDSTATGGTVNGTGGIGTGGTVNGTGGTGTGGVSEATGGVATGGLPAGTGGVATGGTPPTGGTPTGGATGGTPTGGMATGGRSTGGRSTGGTATGGTYAVINPGQVCSIGSDCSLPQNHGLGECVGPSSNPGPGSTSWGCCYSGGGWRPWCSSGVGARYCCNGTKITLCDASCDATAG